jgi:phage baseplate assembly protein W
MVIILSTLKEIKDEIRFKQEALLESDDFHQPKLREGLESLAQVIQNLIIIHKGTYPNQPQLGVGISDYLFEFMDERTLNEISSAIKNQIDEFVTHYYITVTVNVKKLEDLDKVKSNTLGITIDLTNDITESFIGTINYVLLGSNSTKKVVSRAYYS